jgi:serine/threonine protein kinase
MIIGNLNPQNIIIDKNKNIKIGGFGDILDLSKDNYNCSFYQNPEASKEEKFDFKGDMWSLGCILYEMAFKKRIFENEKNIIDINFKIPEKSECNIVKVIEKLICKHDNILEAEKLIYEPIVKKKIIEENLISEIIQNNFEGKKIYIFMFRF